MAYLYHMESITSKVDVQACVHEALTGTGKGDVRGMAQALLRSVLEKKVRFPLLEAAAKEIYKSVPASDIIKLADEIIALRTIGGNVLAGIILQMHLDNDFDRAIKKSVAYIIAGNEWYVCDIIGERVQGHALLTMPERMLPLLKQLTEHEDKWIVRSVGVAAHYAIKKGLKKQYVDEVFQLLLSLGNTTDFHTKKGIGWAAKTAAKFHPDIIEKYRVKIDGAEVKQWFKTKIKIGLGRTSKYAGRY